MFFYGLDAYPLLMKNCATSQNFIAFCLACGIKFPGLVSRPASAKEKRNICQSEHSGSKVFAESMKCAFLHNILVLNWPK